MSLVEKWCWFVSAVWQGKPPRIALFHVISRIWQLVKKTYLPPKTSPRITWCFYLTIVLGVHWFFQCLPSIDIGLGEDLGPPIDSSPQNPTISRTPMGWCYADRRSCRHHCATSQWRLVRDGVWEHLGKHISKSSIWSSQFTRRPAMARGYAI